MMKEIKIPFINNNETHAKLVSWEVDDKSVVKNGDIIATLETTKADVDLECEFDGKIKIVCEPENEYEFGEVVAYVYENEQELKSFDKTKKENKKAQKTIITKPAREYMNDNNISEEDVNKLGLDIVKTKDIKHLIEKNSLNDLSIKKEKLTNDLVTKIKSIDSAKNVIILGGKGGAKMVIDAINSNDQYNVFGILDDNLSIDNKVFDVDVIGKFSLVDELINHGFKNFVIAFGVIENRKKRFELYNEIKAKGGNFVNIIHKRSIVENSVSMGEGNVILAGANVGSAVEIGNLNYINNSCIVSHDCKIKDNVHISPGAVLASSIEVGSHCLIGMNSTLFYGLTVGENSVINNGVIINNDIPKNSFIKLT